MQSVFAFSPVIRAVSKPVHFGSVAENSLTEEVLDSLQLEVAQKSRAQLTNAPVNQVNYTISLDRGDFRFSQVKFSDPKRVGVSYSLHTPGGMRLSVTRSQEKGKASDDYFLQFHSPISFIAEARAASDPILAKSLKLLETLKDKLQ